MKFYIVVLKNNGGEILRPNYYYWVCNQNPTSIRYEEDFEFISMNNIFINMRGKSKIQNNEGLSSK